MKRIFRFPRFSLFVFLFCVLIQAPAAQQEAVMLDSRTTSLLLEEFSGEQAKDHVIAITRHHRIQGSAGYSTAARYVLDQLRSYGFSQDEAWIETFPSDGRVTYQTWQSPSGWRINRARLDMVEPQQELIVRYPDIAMSVITYSNPGHVRAELVDVGAGTSEQDYLGKDVKDKLVLATGYGGEVHRLAVLRYGAAAVVCYLDDDRAAEYPDMLQYTGMWPRTDELERVTFGFNLTNRQGKRLQKLLQAGEKVVLDAQVEGPGLEPGSLDVVVATIPGSDKSEEEVVFVAHLDHPKESANDNASGSAALLDMARSFHNLIRQNRLAPPARTLRFLWVPEFFGTMAYVDAHPEFKGPRLGGKVLAGLNLDMVGENLELLHSRMNLTWTPASIAGALTDVVARTARQVDAMEIRTPRGSLSRFNYRVTPFSGGSDHVILNDGMVRIPAMMLGHWPDFTHHTSEDTPDKVDPVELQRAEFIAGASLWYLANLTDKQSLELTGIVGANAQGRLAADIEKVAHRLLKMPTEQLSPAGFDLLRSIDFAVQRETEALNNILDFQNSNSTRRLVESWTRALHSQAETGKTTLDTLFELRTVEPPSPQTPSPEPPQEEQWIPVRLTRGPLASGLPESRLSKEEASWYSGQEARRLKDRYLLVNFIDGKRTIAEVRDAYAAAKFESIPIGVVERFIRNLEKAGLVRLERTR